MQLGIDLAARGADCGRSQQMPDSLRLALLSSKSTSTPPAIVSPLLSSVASREELLILRITAAEGEREGEREREREREREGDVAVQGDWAGGKRRQPLEQANNATSREPHTLLTILANKR